MFRESSEDTTAEGWKRVSDSVIVGCFLRYSWCRTVKHRVDGCRGGFRSITSGAVVMIIVWMGFVLNRGELFMMTGILSTFVLLDNCTFVPRGACQDVSSCKIKKNEKMKKDLSPYNNRV